MSQRRGAVNEVPDRLRSFAKGQRASMPRAEVLFWEQAVLDQVVAAVESRLVPSPAPLCGAPSPAEGERVVASRIS